MRLSFFFAPLVGAFLVCSALPPAVLSAEQATAPAPVPAAVSAKPAQNSAQTPDQSQGQSAALSTTTFRERYNAAAAALHAPLMPEQPSENVAVPEKTDKEKVRSSVAVYMLNERTSLLLNTPADKPGSLSGAAVMGGGGGDYTLATAGDIQTSMMALVTALTPALDKAAHEELFKGLGLQGGEDNDFTDGKVRSKTVENLLFYTTANENDGIELVVRVETK